MNLTFPGNNFIEEPLQIPAFSIHPCAVILTWERQLGATSKISWSLYQVIEINARHVNTC